MSALIAHHPRRRVKGGRQTNDKKPPKGKWYSNLTNGRETDLCQVQPSKNKGTTKNVVISGRDRIDKEEDQRKAIRK